MEFKELESFITLSNLKSFSKAAEHLFLTQPTISNHIQTLEKELKTILIDRSSKQIQLTPAGEVFLVHAKRILNEKHLAFHSIDEYKGKVYGKLKIACSSIPGKYFLPNVLTEFHRKYPDITYEILQSDTGIVHTMLKNLEIDFGITGMKQDPKNFEYIEIIDDQLVVIAPYDFKADSLSLDELLGYPLILREEGSGTKDTFFKYLEEKSIGPQKVRIIAEVSNNNIIKDLVSKGMGLSIISNKTLKSELANKELKIVQIDDFKICRNFYFTCRKSQSLLPLSIAFKEYVIAHVKLGTCC